MLKGKRGFTLLEILIVMIITGITLPVVGAAFYMLLKVPADETAKLSVLNDVNLALNWIHEDVNRGQFFAGDPAMLRSITTVDFSIGAGTNQSAWDKLGEPANTSDRGTQANASEYQWINASDNYRWNTSLATADAQLDTQMFQFTVPSSLNISDLQGIVVSWKGNGTTVELDHDTSLKIWDNSSGNGSWKLLIRKSGMGTEGWLTGRVTLGTTNPPTNYVMGGKIYILASAERHVAGSSCPHIYGWDGDNYALIDVALTASFMKRYESMTYDSTTMLKPKDGYYDLMAAAQWPHDEYMNSLGLWAVEHSEGTTVIADGLGNVHTLSNPQAVTAVDSYGRDVTSLLSAAGDNALWESDLSGKDFGNISQLHDWVEITLPDRPENGIAKLVVDVASTTLSDTELDGFLHYILGSPNLGYVLDRIQNNPTDMQWFDYNVWLSAALRIQSWNGTAWADMEGNPGILDMSGYLGRPQVVPIDLSQIQGDRIRLLTPAGMHQFDYVAVDYTPDEIVSVNKLTPVEATLYRDTALNVSVTEDVLSQIAATDDVYAYLEQGDYINYRFEALDEPAEGMKRSFIVPVGGYYYREGPVEPEDKMENLEQWEHMLYTPYAGAQHFLPIYVDPGSYPDFQAFHSSKECIQPEFLVNTTHNSLITNYIKLMLLAPIAKYNCSDGQCVASANGTYSNLSECQVDCGGNTSAAETTYGGFFWVDRTGNESISYTTHYYFLDESHRLIREEWRDNELVSTITMAFNIQNYTDITFDFTPAGTQSTVNILPYVVVDITASAGQGDMYTEAHGMSLMALRSIPLSQGFAVLTTQGVGTGKDGILISGRKLFVDGSMRSLGNITVTGEDNLIAGNLISGTAQAAGAIVDNGGAIADPQEYQTLGRVDFGGLVLADFVDNASTPASNEYIFSGDVNLDTAGYWADPPTNTVLRPGVYYSTNGNISLSKANVRGMVTLVSPQGRVTITSQDSYLSPFCNGVLLFSNASYDDAIRFSGNGGGWSGSLFAPYGGVVINGTMTKSFCLFGSIGAQRFTYGANSSQPFMIKF